MRNNAKKILSIVAAATLLGATLATTACGDKEFFTQDKLSGYEPNATVVSNGGFAVEKGDYIYYINGVEDYTADNTFGDVVKGALMRVEKSAFSGNPKDYASKAETVVPMLFVSQNYNAGIYIYGNEVYYATPTTRKNMKGEVTNTWIDFKSASLDGSKTMKDYYFSLSDNAAKYRFVEENDVVYCLYEEDGMLKSYNTKEEKTTVLVKGGTYFYDQKDLTNGNVYYTMGVQTNITSDAPTTESYNQIYCVNAAATATVNKDEASYTVEGGRTYDFDKAWMEEKNEEAKKEAKKNKTEYEATYVFDDYSTYPYVNLGTLVVDGVGLNQVGENEYNNTHAVTDRVNSLKGYTYTLTRYENGGIYYTKASDSTDNALYYLPENHGKANAAAANSAAVKLAWDTTNASADALFEVNADGTHTYLYIADSKINRATVTTSGEWKEEKIVLCDAPSDAKLWKTADGYVYYYGAGTHPVTSASSGGYKLSRICYTGDKEVYELLVNPSQDAKYRPLTIEYVDFSSKWYMPEMFGNVLLYANAEKIGDKSYNYVYATDLTKIEENNEKYEAVYKQINEVTENADLKAAMTYYYRTGDKELVKELYEAKLFTKTQYEEVFTVFANDVDAGKYVKEDSLIGLVGKVKDSDQETMKEAWKSTLPSEEEVAEEEKSLETWQICLIVAAAVVLVAAVVIVVVVLVNKKKAEREEANATVNAYKRPKIDTTDDKTIDVYADDEQEAIVEAEAVEEVQDAYVEAEKAEETAETPAEAPVAVSAEEAVEAPAEAPVEETAAPAEAPAEETVEAPAEEAAAPVEETPAETEKTE